MSSPQSQPSAQNARSRIRSGSSKPAQSSEASPAPTSATPLLQSAAQTGESALQPPTYNTIAAESQTTPQPNPSFQNHISLQELPDDVFEQEFQIDEDLSFVAEGRQTTPLRTALCVFLYIVSGGTFYLLCRWNCAFEVAVRTRRCTLRSASHVYIRNHWGEASLEPVQKCPFPDGHISDAFPQLFGPLASTHTDAGSPEPPSFAQTESPRTAVSDNPLPFLVHFEYRYFKFMLEPISGKFVPNYIWSDPRWRTVAHVLATRDSNQSIDRKRIFFGPNAIDIKEKSTIRLLVDEVLHPFFVFQIASIILWSLDQYYYYAACIFVISTTSAVATLFETKTMLRRMRDLSRFSCQIRYWRNGSWSYGRSEELVPGDLVELESGQVPIVPCDAILLEGDCIINESMLTGESLAVSKTPAMDVDIAALNFEEEEPSSSSRMSRFFLFSGTEIIRVRPGTIEETGDHWHASLHDQGRSFMPKAVPPPAHANGGPLATRRGAVALVVRTGFNTTKGNLIRSMLFPRPNKFKFYQDSFRFIGVLATISVLGFLASLYNFIQLQMPWTTIFVRALDLVTIVVPPALPATLAIGTSFAIRRLRLGDIFCTSPPRVNICGKLNVMCFDKTGTLTQEGLDVLGIRFTVPQNKKTDMPYEEVEAHTPLRFSRLYELVDAVMIKPVIAPLPSTDYRMQPTSPGRLRSSISQSYSYTQPTTPIQTHMSNISGASIFLANETGHPNSETDFPYPLIVCAMATCHSIKVVHGTLIGDPLDLKMFDFTGWHIEEDMMGGSGSGGVNINQALRRVSRHASCMVVRPPWAPDFDTVVNGARSGMRVAHDEVYTELGVVRSFEFVSNLRRMSVIVRRMKYSHGMFETISGNSNSGNGSNSANKELEIFVKGAPEVMRSICTFESVPPDYDDQLREYTHHGYRVIACAYRKLENVSWSTMLKMKRSAVECDLQFLGFIVFENKLKPGTTPVVKTLKRAGIRQIMCTGDSLLTSVSVSRECELVDPHRKVFVPRFVEGEAHESNAKIVWEDVDGSGALLDNVTLLPLESNLVHGNPAAHLSAVGSTGSLASELAGSSWSARQRSAANMPRFVQNMNSIPRTSEIGYDLAITGSVFQWMLDFASDETFERMLVKCQIFSRMSPDQKHFLVENLQRIGYCVGFCGDGTNDCGALKAADAGLSLSEAEASVAAPFTSKSKDLDCVLRVVREGRVALVTSFSCFKYMALYSLIQFTTVSLLYAIGQNIRDFQFMFIDICLIIPIAVFMGWTGPHPSIDRKRPTASLVSKRVLTSLIGQLAVQIVFQVAAFFWIRTQEWYVPGIGDYESQTYLSMENSVLFLISCFQYISVAFVFTVGPPYQEPVWKNVPYVVTLVVLAGVTVLLTACPPQTLAELLGIVEMPLHGRIIVLMLGISNFGLSLVLERSVFPVIARSIGRLMDYVSFARASHSGYVAVSTESNSIPSAADRSMRMHKWRQKGKLYKVIEAELLDEAHYTA